MNYFRQMGWRCVTVCRDSCFESQSGGWFVWSVEGFKIEQWVVWGVYWFRFWPPRCALNFVCGHVEFEILHVTSQMSMEMQLLMMSKLCSPRRGWLLQGLPVSLKGIGGPGAPHVFLFQRMCNSGAVEELSRARNAKHHTHSKLTWWNESPFLMH